MVYIAAFLHHELDKIVASMTATPYQERFIAFLIAGVIVDQVELDERQQGAVVTVGKLVEDVDLWMGHGRRGDAELMAIGRVCVFNFSDADAMEGKRDDSCIECLLRLSHDVSVSSERSSRPFCAPR